MGKHAKVKVYEKYDPEGKLSGEKCPRCSGLLANHKNRVTCGKCGYSEIRKGVELKEDPKIEKKEEQKTEDKVEEKEQKEDSVEEKKAEEETAEEEIKEEPAQKEEENAEE